MEGIDAFSFQEPMNTKSRILETITSWLDLDESFNNTSFPQELQDLQMLDDHFFQFATTTTTTTNTTTNLEESDDHEPLPHLPGPDSPFILDLHDFDQPPPPPANNDGSVLPELSIVPEPDECDTFLINETDFGIINAALAADQQTSPDCMSIDTNHFVDSIISNSSPEMEHDHDQQQHPPIIIHEKSSPEPQQDTGDDEDEENDEDPKKGTLNCKNLVSERNRRKRLSQQLLALRALVPNITKMDKRSVLVDALSYLKSMQEETARLQREIRDQPPRLSVDSFVDDEEEDGTQRTPRTLASCTAAKPKPQIIEIDTEKIEDKRFVVKITCKGANVGGDVLRVIESLGFEITYAALDQLKPQHILTTIFIRVKKQEKMTEEKLKDCIISTALRSGLTLVHPSS